MTNIQDTRVQVNGVQIGKLKEDEQASDATRALLAQSSAQRSHGESRMDHSINQKPEISEAGFIACKQEKSALKNQLVQTKEINKFKTLTDSIETQLLPRQPKRLEESENLANVRKPRTSNNLRFRRPFALW